MNIVRNLLAASAVVLFLVPSNASATEYPGAICQVESGSGGQLVNYYGTIYNSSSTSDMQVICPVAKNDLRISDGTTVGVLNRNATVPFTCSLFQEYLASDGGIWHWSETHSLSSWGSGLQTLSFDYQQANASYYYVQCTVPRSYSGNMSHVAYLNILETSI
jgi:hypothetical protein